jgi:UDP-N-acetylglucosamine 2-epimerase
MEQPKAAKIITVVGARPNFMKAAPIIAAIQSHNERLAIPPDFEGLGNSYFKLQSVLVHTGQHYDEAMSDRFFTDLNIPKPDVHLGVGSASHAAQTAEVMKRFEQILLQERPDLLVVVGDVNSTLACALVAAKISFDASGTRPLIAHVEAGLRSFDRSMPEEINRIVTDHVADLLFVTEESGLRNLREEGVQNGKVHFVGNTMIDSLLAFKDKADSSKILDKLNLRNCNGGHGSIDGITRYALLTLHRPSNVDQRSTLLNILEGLEELSNSCPIIFPVHPRTQKKLSEFGFERFFRTENGDCEGEQSRPAHADGRIRLVEPLGYLDFLCLMGHAAVVVTDSGGIQEETTCLGIPCVTVRENTERPITVKVGTNILAGTSKDGIRQATRRQLESKTSGAVPEAWDGMSARRILEVICCELEKTGRFGSAPTVPAAALGLYDLHATVKPKMTRYVIITPVRDEEKHIERTIESVCRQTILPSEWVIADDGSTDRTGDILDRVAAQFPWIRVIHRTNRGFRKSGGGVMEAFYDGYNALQCKDWDFIVKLDGDLSFRPEYFEKCFEYFDTDSELGIGGGEIYHDISGNFQLEKTPRFHVRGATKIYKRRCWEAIGGLWPAPGWDTIDEVKANMLGWKTYAFADLHLLHHRFTGSEDGILRDRMKHGLVCYISGYHPLFVAASCLRRMTQRPYIIGSGAIMYGFIKGHLTRPPRLKDKSYFAYIRGQQLRRLCGMQTIWR